MSEKEGQLHWRPVVKELYHGGYVLKTSDEDEWKYEIYHPIGQETELDHEELQRALSYMDRNGLVHETERGDVALTEVGLKIAFDMSSNERQERVRERQESINKSIMLAATVTALATILVNWPPDSDVIPLTLPSVVDTTFVWLNSVLTVVGIIAGAVLLGVLVNELLRLYGTDSDTLRNHF